MDFLLSGIMAITWQQCVMYLVGCILIYLAIEKGFEPSLLLPMGFGAILVNLPVTGVLDQVLYGSVETNGIIQWLFEVGIEASEALPILLFIGIGAMIDFGPLLSNPKMFLFGAAAQFGIFFTIVLATILGFDLSDAASIGIIGAADGPTSILVSQILDSKYMGAIAVAAYSYMALVPIVQPFAIKLVTTKKERMIRMNYNPTSVTKTTRIMFPIIVTIIAGLIAPMSVALVGFLMFGN
jgi:oxaloacetate decarboxylase beta subunit